MFKKLDDELKYLTDYIKFLGEDYFHDEGFFTVQQLLSKFSRQDYEILLNNLHNKSLKYKEYLAYVISDKDIEITELEQLIKDKINDL